MATTPPGLAALQQALTDLTKAVSDAVTEIKNLASQVGASTEDPAVQQLAAQIETQASNLEAAVTAAQPPAPPATGTTGA